MFSDQLVDHFPQFTALCLLCASLPFLGSPLSCDCVVELCFGLHHFPLHPLPCRGLLSSFFLAYTLLNEPKSQRVYCHRLAVQLFDSTLTTFEKMPNSIIFGVCCQPEATKSSVDITSNLISLPDGGDPGLKFHCLLKDKPMSYSIWSNKHSGYAL